MLKDLLQVTTDASDSTPVQISTEDLSTPENARAYGVRTAKDLAKKPGKYALCMSPKAKNVHEFAIGFGQAVPAFSLRKDAAPVTVCVAPEHEQTFAAAALAMVKVRELVVMPANLATPQYLVQDLWSLAKTESCVEFMSPPVSESSFTHIIGRSSENEPAYARFFYNGRKDSDDIDLALAMKGCTFDAGGVNMKPAVSSVKMKKDMGAAALGIGLAQWLLATRPNVNVLIGFAFAENMVSSTAMRPGDVYPFMDAHVEITNTDAEGRLLLADAMWAMLDYGTPKNLIALGTLTAMGSSVFGGRYIPLWAQDGGVDRATVEAGARSGDLVWSLPLDRGYYKAIKSSAVADYVNSVRGKGASSGVAAVFLHEMAKQCYGDDLKNFSMLDISSSAMGGAGVENYAGEPVGAQDASGASLNLLIHRVLMEAD